MSEVFWAFAALEIVKTKTAMIRVFIYRGFMPVPPENVLTGASLNSAIEQGCRFFDAPDIRNSTGKISDEQSDEDFELHKARSFPLERLREKNAESFRSQQWSESTRG